MRAVFVAFALGVVIAGGLAAALWAGVERPKPAAEASPKEAENAALPAARVISYDPADDRDALLGFERTSPSDPVSLVVMVGDRRAGTIALVPPLAGTRDRWRLDAQVSISERAGIVRLYETGRSEERMRELEFRQWANGEPGSPGSSGRSPRAWQSERMRESARRAASRPMIDSNRPPPVFSPVPIVRSQR
ncbi:hypothetical protein [Sphingomonas cavernae]|uniref:Uncharacterized protein n=1 Tax=Sphingomonas cavernae TaxID=2320861 RepID=A0A418WRS0_9SPHN|nr:hypothetical protein [Sphingomonas cavernae]RJF93960.1 hypothetical protein D3876_06730 [Sphingomonas cavernae]